MNAFKKKKTSKTVVKFYGSASLHLELGWYDGQRCIVRGTISSAENSTFRNYYLKVFFVVTVTPKSKKSDSELYVQLNR